jgi:putative transposase
LSALDRRAMLDRADTALSVRRQCALLGVARSGVCRVRKPANDNDAALMSRIDELFTAWPFLGSRRISGVDEVVGALGWREEVEDRAPAMALFAVV